MAAVRATCGADEARGLERLHGAYVDAALHRDLALVDLESCLATGERAARVGAADASVAEAALAACRAREDAGAPWWLPWAAGGAGLVVGAAGAWVAHP